MTDHNTYAAIVIGASAGGFFAISALLKELPYNYPKPIIIVQHRSKDTGDLFEEVLQNHCKITIKQADEKEKIENGIVYIAPPGYHLLIESDCTFSLSADAPVHFSRPSIDVLFETASNVYRHKLVGILLTGANNDGAEGIQAIHKNNGLTIAQSPEEAAYAIMPLAAIATKKVKHIFTLAEIQVFLLKIISSEK